MTRVYIGIILILLIGYLTAVFSYMSALVDIEKRDKAIKQLEDYADTLQANNDYLRQKINEYRNK